MAKVARVVPPRPAGPPALVWAQQFLPNYISAPPCSFHIELMTVLAEPAKRLVARVAPRGHAKSTCAALAYPLWCVCERHRRNIVIATQESSLATQFVCDIRTELESNERILAEYGDLCRPPGAAMTKPVAKTRTRPQPADRPVRRTRWSAAFFTTTTGITVQAKGSGASFRGLRVGPNRPDLVICDDLEKDEHVETSEGRRKLERWLRRVVMPALAPQGQLLVLGSIIHYDSLLASLRDKQRFPGWDYAVYRALEAEPQPDGTFRHVALWPARWPVEALEAERERIGTLAFEAEYQANPIDDTIRVFRPEWLHRYDERELVPERLVTFMAVDPATGATAGDYFALWIGSRDTATGIIYTRRLMLKRINIVAQVKCILTAFRAWKPVRVGIETVAYQAALKDILEEESRKLGLYMSIVGLRSTERKEARIEGSSALYENGTFRLPAVLDPEIERQFLHFPKAGHDDAPDVCAMGIELARSLCAAQVEGATGAPNPRARHGGW